MRSHNMRGPLLLILLAALLAAVLAWSFTTTEPSPDSSSPTPEGTADTSKTGNSTEAPASGAPSTLAATVRELANASPTTGLLVRVKETRSGQDLSDIPCEIARGNGHETFPFTVLGTTDGTGTIADPQRSPGSYAVRAIGQDEPTWVEVIPEALTEVELHLPGLTTYHGHVVDGTGSAVTGADVFITGCHTVGRDTRVASSDADGRFEFACRGNQRLTYAQAATQGCSRPVPLSAPALATEELTLRLDHPVTRIVGRVVDVTGDAVAGARIAIGRHDRSARHETTTAQYRGTSGNLQPRLVELVSDEDGRFMTNVAPIGPRAFAFVRAEGFAAHREPITVPTRDSTEVMIRLERSATLQGTTRDRHGRPCGNVAISVDNHHEDPEWLGHRTISAADGWFRLTGLPAGNLRAQARHRRHGRALERFDATPGGILPWNPTLDPGLVISGRLTDARDEPLAGWRVTASNGKRHRELAVTERDGTFNLLQCRDEPYTVKVAQLGAWMPTIVGERAGVMPGSGIVNLRIRDQDLASCWITGEIRASTGQERACTTSVRIETPKLGQQMSMALPPGPFRLGPFLPARFEVSFALHGHQTLRTVPFALEAGATHELGKLTAKSLARVTIHVVAEGGTALTTGQLHVLDARGNSVNKHPVTATGVTLQMTPGKHRILVTAPDHAFGAATLTLSAGERSTTELKVHRGLPCEFVFLSAAATVQGYVITAWHSESHGALGGNTANPALEEGDRATIHRRLPPGNYRAEFRSREHNAEVNFTVADGAKNRFEVRLQRTRSRSRRGR